MPTKMQSGFVGGELAPSLYARVDLDKYNFGCKTLQNFFVLAHGGACNRAGFEFCQYAKYDDRDSVLIPFKFSTTQTYQLELGDQYMRFWQDGSLIVESAKTITGITQANPAVFSHTAHGYVAGQWLYVTDLADGTGNGKALSKLNNKFYVVDQYSADTYTLKPVSFSDNYNPEVDGTQYKAYSSGGHTARVYEIATPYVEADLLNIDYFQSFDILTLTHVNYQQADLKRISDTNWTLTTINFQTLAATPNTGPTLTTGGALTGTGDTTQYVYTAIIAGEESLPSPYTGIVTPSAWPAGSSMKISIPAWVQPGTPDGYNIYKRWAGTGIVDGPYGWIGYTTEADNRIFIDRNLLPDAGKTVLFDDRNPLNATGLYPGTGCYYKQRKIFGGLNNEPESIYTTRIATYQNMNDHVPILDDDAITFQVNSVGLCQIRYMVPLDKIVVLTSGGVFIVGGDQNGVFAPATISAAQDGDDGCAHVKPIMIGNACIFVQDLLNVLKGVEYTFISDKYVAQDLSILSSHLFEGRQIVQMAYQKTPFSLVWASQDNGNFLSLTYQKEHNVFAWTRHNTQGKIGSVSVIPEGNEHVLYAMTRRKLSGTWRRCVERMRSRVIADVRDGFFVDCGLTYDPKIPVTAVTVYAGGIIAITAYSHGYVNGNLVDLSDIEGTTQLNLNRYQVGETGANYFYLKKEHAKNNYITNPLGMGNTIGESGWTLNNCTVDYGHPDPYGGNNAIKVTVTGNLAYILQYLTETSAVCRSLSMWIKKGNTTDSGYVMGNGNGNFASGNTSPADWTNLKVENFTPPSNMGYGIIFSHGGIYGPSNPGDTYYLYGPLATDEATARDFQSDYVDGTDYDSYDENGYTRLALKKITGLDHLEGMGVACLSDGNPVSGITVTDGSITLPRAGSRVHIGLPYTSTLETLDLELQTVETPGHKKNISEVTVKVKDTRGGYFGPGNDTSKPYPLKQRKTTDGVTVPMQTAEFQIPVSGDWNSNGRTRITQSDPLPMTILSITPAVDVGG